ncbi:MAG TPA: Rieske 2Fe-2S domain-containing protein [Polyangiaceae bacterium]|nr:Rieske 2Fe-2S domain-containing protein [Polyangiaceae bacterium]
MPEIRVVGVNSLGEGQSQTFGFEREVRGIRHRHEGFVLRHRGQLLAFHNECPHWSVELDLGDGHFYDEALDRIYCKNHGALFLLPSGLCETGPCLGRSLTSFPVRSEGDDAVVCI